jgi:hypothetical protein
MHTSSTSVDLNISEDKPLEFPLLERQTLLQAIDACDHEFYAILHGHAVNFRSDEAETGDILKFLFDLQAQVVTVEKADCTSPVAAWRIGIIRSDDILTQWAGRRAVDPAGAFAGLRSYWRPDFPSVFLALSPELTVVRHTDPFRGLTVFMNDERLIVYIRPEAEQAFIPHVETLAGYVWRCAMWNAGFLDLHSAMVRYLGQGAVIIGPKMAGKTSLAMHFLARGGDLLGSDFGEIAVSPNGTLQAKAVPHICRITPETILDNAFLHAAVDTEPRTGHAYRDGPVFSHGKYEFFAPGLDGLFGRPVNIRSMDVDLLIFPRFSKDTVRQRITPVEPETARTRLVHSIRHDRPLADWLPFSEVGSRETREAPLLDGLANVPLRAFQIEFGQEPSLVWDDIGALFSGHKFRR